MFKLASATILVAILAACGGGGTESTADTPTIIELNGDSIMYGLGLNKRPADTLQELLPDFKVVDRSVTGLTLNSLFAGYITAWVGGPPPRFGPQPAFHLIERRAQYVVISLGGNDAYGDLPIENFARQLEDTILTIRAEGRTPITTGIVKVTPGPVFDINTVLRIAEFNTKINFITDKLNVPNVRWDTVENTDTLDGIHRTQAASDTLMAQLANTIKAISK